MNAITRNTLIILIGTMVGIPAGVFTFFATHKPAAIVESDLTKREPGCFDGTLEKGCPDFNMTPPKPIKNVTLQKDGSYLIEYSDGSVGH